MVDVEKILKNTIKNGKVKIGAKQTEQTLKDGSAKIIIMANNCPYSNEINNLAKKKKIPVYNSESNSINLGYICGKNFSVSVFAVLDDGGTNVNSLIKKK